jgi:hypothetical protein
MKTVVGEIQGDGKQAGRYMMVNYNPMQFSKDGSLINRLHFEIRCPDGNMSPSALTSFGVLFHAMLLKSVDLSVNGILERGDKDDADQNAHVCNLILNNDGSYDGPRTSNTKQLNAYYPFLIERSLELVSLLRGDLSRQGNAYNVLKRLAKRPCSMRRASGDTWETIEKDLSATSKKAVSAKVDMIIDTVAIVECADLGEWVGAAAEDGGVSKQDIEEHVKALQQNGQAFWDPSLGSLVRS